MTIQTIFHNSFANLTFVEDTLFLNYLNPSSTTHFLDIIRDVNETLFSQGDSITFTNQTTGFNVKVVYLHNQYIVFGNYDNTNSEDFIKELLDICNDQLNEIALSHTTMKSDDFDATIFDEMAKLNNQLRNIQRTLNQKNAELTALNIKFKRMGLFDFLTDLPNRRSFFDDIHKALIEENYDLIMLDLNNFKLINDQMGHDKGDEVLIIFSNMLRNYVPIESEVYRLGGDEFAILHPYRVVINIDQIITAIENELRKVHKSLGVAYGKVLMEKDGNVNDLVIEKAMRQADNLMYLHKQKVKSAQ